jgi:tripartite-type tricarboxylate transporter receptor subunit TctC
MFARFIFVSALLAATPAAAQAYPAKPIRLVVGFAPGGGTDIAARIVAKKFGELLGQQVVVENKSGAGGNIATEFVARAPADGYTLLVGSIGPLSISPSLYKDLGFDPLKDLASISMMSVFSNVLVVHPSVPAQNPREFIALAKAKPGAVFYGSSGNAGAGHLAGELLRSLTKAPIVHVPYKGGGPAMTDLLAGQVQAIFATTPTAIPNIKAGRIRALGVTTARRALALPEVPTLAEAGVPGYEAANWYCLNAPARTPKDILALLHQDFVKALVHPEVASALAQQGMEPSPSTPEELASYTRAEQEKWARVVREAGIVVQ